MSAGPTPVEEEPLVLRGRFSTRVGLALIFPVVFGTMVGGSFFFGRAVRGETLFALPGVLGNVVVAGTAVLWYAAIFCSIVWLNENSSTVTLYAGGVVLGQGGRAMRFAWSDFLEYRDGSSGRVRMVFKRWRIPIAGVAVPTLNEADRVAVLARLDRAGIPRAS